MLDALRVQVARGVSFIHVSLWALGGASSKAWVYRHATSFSPLHGAAFHERGGRDWKIEQLGPYRLEAECGRGGMSVVYSAVHVSLGTRHAVKVFDAGNRANAGVLRGKFLAEARILATLRHPCIVRVTDYGGATGGRGWRWTLSKGRRLPHVCPLPCRQRRTKHSWYIATFAPLLPAAIRMESCMAT